MHLNNQGISSGNRKTEATMDFSLAYGLPGKPNYRHTRPFDYFQFESTSLGNSKNPFDDIKIRGLLLGKDYEAGNDYRGIWGLYGGYDYISPHIFRISSVHIAFGTTYQWSPSRELTVQGSAIGGVGYAAAGNVTQVGERDYHYGIAPRGLVALRLILGNRVMLDSTDRAYYLTGIGGSDPGGREMINRLNVGLHMRIIGPHAFGIQYITSRRDARYPDRVPSHQSTGTVSLVYTLLGDIRFGAVDWRGTNRP